MKTTMKASSVMALVVAAAALALPACHRLHGEGQGEGPEGEHKILVTTAKEMDVTVTQRYVCRIRSQRNIEVKALQEGYLEEIPIKEGQAVKKDEVLFRVIPAIYKAQWESEKAEAQVAYIEYINTQQLAKGDRPVVSQQEVAIYEAKWKRAQARAERAKVEWDFTIVKAPFDGIVDRLRQMQGSLVKKDDVLTTLSDNSTMWVYFNVPEARYLEYTKRAVKDHAKPPGGDSPSPMAHLPEPKTQPGKRQPTSRLELVDSRIDLMLADGTRFDQDPGNVVTVEGEFNFETGNIPFRSDFQNPNGLLRHGQTGTILIHHRLHKARVIPQRATFEILDKQYVWVIGEDKVVHQRPIVVAHELEDAFVIKSGLNLTDKFILDGVRQVKENDRLEEFEFESPDAALAHLKFRAE